MPLVQQLTQMASCMTMKGCLYEGIVQRMRCVARLNMKLGQLLASNFER